MNMFVICPFWGGVRAPKKGVPGQVAEEASHPAKKRATRAMKRKKRATRAMKRKKRATRAIKRRKCHARDEAEGSEDGRTRGDQKAARIVTPADWGVTQGAV